MALAATTHGRPRFGGIAPVFLLLAGAAGLSGCVQSTASSNPPIAAGTTLAAPPATGEPVVLSGVAYTEADIAAHPKPVGPSQADIIKPSGSTNQAVASTELPGSSAPVYAAPPPKPAPQPVIASTPAQTEPLPGLEPAQTEPLPGLSAAPAPVAAAPKPAPSVTPPQATQVISAPSPVGVTPSMPTITTMGAVPAPAVDEKGFPNINVPPRQPGGQLLSDEERAKLIAELNALAGRPTP